MSKLYKCLSFFILISNFSLTQNHIQNECNMNMVGEEFQFIYEDSIQIVISFNKEVNLDNDFCKKNLIEGYSNYIPREGINVICVLTIDGDAMKKFNGFNYYSFFQNVGREKELLSYVIAGYIYDIKSEYSEVYFGHERIMDLFKINPKVGLNR